MVSAVILLVGCLAIACLVVRDVRDVGLNRVNIWLAIVSALFIFLVVQAIRQHGLVL